MSAVPKTTAEASGLAQHPKYFGCKVNSEMKLPGDVRLFRDIKVHEIPQWIMKRDWSPLGLWFSMKRVRHRFHTKYLFFRNSRGVYVAQLAFLMGIGGYLCQYEYLQRTGLQRKYH